MNIIKYLKEKNYNGIDDEISLRADFYKKDITVSYEKDFTNGTRRYVFSASGRSKKNTYNSLCTEANGLILLAPEWTPLVIPPLTPRTNIDSKLVNNFIKNEKYDIYFTQDGSVINLYNFDNKWNISTAKGIEVNEKKFNTKTYSEMFHESLTENVVNPEEFFGSLNKDFCYTLGFKHPDIHPFCEGKSKPIFKVWFIQLNNVKNPSANPVRVSPFKGIKNHTKVSFNVKSVGILFNKMKASFELFISQGRANYGFMLVAKDVNDFANNREYCNIILESSLMVYLRKLFYDASYSKFSKLREYNRVNVILLNAFLDSAKTELFSILFPQYRGIMGSLVKIETEIVELVYKKLKEPIVVPSIAVVGGEVVVPNVTILQNPDRQNNTVNETADEIVDWAAIDVEIGIDEFAELKSDIVDILARQIKDKITISAHERPRQLIHEIIRDIKNIDIYYKLFDLVNRDLIW